MNRTSGGVRAGGREPPGYSIELKNPGENFRDDKVTTFSERQQGLWLVMHEKLGILNRTKVY